MLISYKTEKLELKSSHSYKMLQMECVTVFDAWSYLWFP